MINYTEQAERLRHTQPYSKILAALGHGEGQAVQLKNLISVTGVNDRLLRKSIETLRRAGICIISDNHGYYFPATLEEVRRYRAREEHRARSVFYTIRTARQTEKEMTLQQQLTGSEN